jgi:hypothetical protein
LAFLCIEKSFGIRFVIWIQTYLPSSSDFLCYTKNQNQPNTQR